MYSFLEITALALAPLKMWGKIPFGSSDPSPLTVGISDM
jgi:hypothetical protein